MINKYILPKQLLTNESYCKLISDKNIKIILQFW